MRAVIQIALLCGVMVTTHGQGEVRFGSDLSGFGGNGFPGGSGGLPPYRGAERGSFGLRTGGSRDVSGGAFRDGIGSSSLSRGPSHVPDLDHSFRSNADSHSNTDLHTRRRSSSRRDGPISRRGSRRGGRGRGRRVQIIGGEEGYFGARGGQNGFPYMGGAGHGPPFSDGGQSIGVANGIGTGSIEAFYQRRSQGGVDYSLGPNGPMLPPQALMDETEARALTSGSPRRGSTRGAGIIGAPGMGGSGLSFPRRPGIGGPGFGVPGPGYSVPGTPGMGGPGMGGPGMGGLGMGGPGIGAPGMFGSRGGGGYRGFNGGSMHGPAGGYPGMGGYPGSGAGGYPSAGGIHLG